MTKKLSGPIHDLKKISTNLNGSTVDVDLFKRAGVFVVKKLFTQKKINEYLEKFHEFSGYKDILRNPFNPVDVRTDDVDLKALAREPLLVDEIQKILGPDVAMYSFRFVVKDSINTKPVFLHNDISYHLGGIDRLSAFVALTKSNIQNGGLTFYLGTHNFGMLADAGEIDVSVLPSNWPFITPDVEPGDVVLMHSALWHCSGENLDKSERIMSDIHYQPATDPSGQELIAGKWRTEYRIPEELYGKLFKRSRISRLIDLEDQLNNFRKKSL